VTGLLFNLILLYHIQRFSTRELGTYKYLLEILAAYDTCLVVIHHVTYPITIPSSTAFAYVADRSFGTLSLAAFYSSCYAVPFVLLNVHLLYRYWTVCYPHKIALFTCPKFVTALLFNGALLQLS
ncbi:hypothetical protein PFISCL1PPCAC_13943, partial [Pristionchus fissidentatus]